MSRDAFVIDPLVHISDFLNDFHEDHQFVVEVINGLNENTLSEKAKEFLSHIASLWENLRPAKDEKDVIFAIQVNGSDFIRTFPEVAMEMHLNSNSVGVKSVWF